MQRDGQAQCEPPCAAPLFHCGCHLRGDLNLQVCRLQSRKTVVENACNLWTCSRVYIPNPQTYSGALLAITPTEAIVSPLTIDGTAQMYKITPASGERA